MTYSSQCRESADRFNFKLLSCSQCTALTHELPCEMPLQFLKHGRQNTVTAGFCRGLLRGERMVGILSSVLIRKSQFVTFVFFLKGGFGSRNIFTHLG